MSQTIVSGVSDKRIGCATASVGRCALFDNPEWEERFDVLIRFTQRTETIYDLTGSNISKPRLKAAMNTRLEAMGIPVARPRGISGKPDSKGFLDAINKKYDAAYLVGLHFGGNDPRHFEPIELQMGPVCDKRIQTYTSYFSALYDRMEDAAISFDTYHLLIKSIRSGGVSVHRCADCTSQYVWPQSAHAKAPSCPICATNKHDLKSSIRYLQKLSDSKSAADRLQKVGKTG